MNKKYIEVYNIIRNSIISGAYAYGQKIPSKRAAADMTKCSVITVEHAYDILQSEGYIDSKERSGYYVTYVNGETFNESREHPPVSVAERAPSIEKTVFPFSVLSSAVRCILNDFGDTLLQKSPNSGVPELKNAIKNYLYRNRGVLVDERRIVIGAGAEYLYGIITQLLGLDLVYGIETPSYEQIENVYTAYGVRCDRLALGTDGILSTELRRTNAKVLHVTPYRSFPTGVTATASKKQEYLRWANERNGYVIEDDYESEFCLSGKIAETIFGEGKEQKVIYVNTFSKTISPAIRIGYMLLPESLVDRFYGSLGFYSCTAPVLEQQLIARLLNDGSFERHLNRVRRKLRRAAK